MKTSYAVILLFLSTLFAAGCGSGEKQSQSTASSEPLVTGTVTYRERVALPADAVIDLWIMDATPGIITQAILAETSINTEGRQVPINFTLAYAPDRVVTDHDYAIKAVIRGGGESLFETVAGTPVITRGAPMKVDLVLTSAQGGAMDSTAGGNASLVGTRWKLSSIGGAAALDGVEATLEFAEPGKVAGKASCNRYFGSVEINGDAVTFSQMGSTKMMCAENIMAQETAFLKALGAAQRAVRDGANLVVSSADATEELRFAPAE